MKKTLFYAGISVLAVLIVLAACKKEAQKETDRDLNAGTTAVCPTQTLPNVITGSMTLTNDKVWILDGKCYVDAGATLTINPGVRIEGIRKDSAKFASALVVCRGAQIFANGDSCNPIVFTARIDGTNPTKNPGDWGGVVILGRAGTNKLNPTIEGIDLPTLPIGITPSDVAYGHPTIDGDSTFDAENSGVFKYVRIEYAGAVLSPNVELNGLTMGGVGSGTDIHHVEVAWGADDAFEFFGGTVNVDHLVALAPNDDCFDFDQGYRGAVQFALGVRSNCCFTQTFADANGIECDNDAAGVCAPIETPRTRPVVSNMTLVGGETAFITGTLNGVRFRRATDLIMRNSVIMGYNVGNVFEGACTPTTYFQNNLVHYFGTPAVTPPTNTYYTATATSNDDIQLDNPFFCGTNGTGLNFAPIDGFSPAASGASFANLPPMLSTTAAALKTVSYRGAFPVANREWLRCWTICIGFVPPAQNCE